MAAHDEVVMAIDDEAREGGRPAEEDVGWEWERDLEAQGHGGCWERSHLEAAFDDEEFGRVRNASPTLRRTDVRIYEEVWGLLTEHPLLDGAELEVEVVEAVVIVRGEVATADALALCQALLEEVRGLAGARLHVEVTPPQFEPASHAGDGEEAFGTGR